MGEFHISDAMKQFVSKSKLKNGLQSVEIELVWQNIMGKTIAKYTDKIQVINQTLFIHTSVGPLKQELLYQKEKIIERINDAMREKIITEVVVK